MDSVERREGNDGREGVRETIGLCATCAHCRRVETGRSTFYLCQRSFTDPAYRKYPPLPVIICAGHQETT